MLSLKLKIYLDTSVISFIYADDAPEKRDITKDYFEKYIKTKIYEHKISTIVTDELSRTNDESLRTKLLKVPGNYDIDILSMEPAEELANNRMSDLLDGLTGFGYDNTFIPNPVVLSLWYKPVGVDPAFAKLGLTPAFTRLAEDTGYHIPPNFHDISCTALSQLGTTYFARTNGTICQ